MVRTAKILRPIALCLALGVSLGLGLTQTAAAATSVSLNVASNDPDGVAKVLLGGAMAAFFGMDPQVNVGITAQSSGGGIKITPNAQVSIPIANQPASQPAQQVIVRPVDPFEQLPVWYVSGYYNVEPARIIELRRQGRHWTEVAEYYRLPEDLRGRWVIVQDQRGRGRGRGRERRVFVPYTDDEFERIVRIRFVEEYYGVPRTTVTIWLNQGLSMNDIFITVNLAGRAHVRPEQVVEYRRRGYSWDKICSRYGVPYSALSQPITPTKKAKYKVKWDKHDKGEWGKGYDD